MKVSQVFFILGISFATIGTIACILAFGLPSWLYTYDDDSNQGIDNAGLWVFCLETFFDYRQRTQGSKPCNNQGNSRDLSCFNGGVPMYGCHWIYSDDLESIRWTILNPDWFIAVQIMATVNLMLALLGLIGLYVICLVRKNKCPLIFGIVSQFFCFILGLAEVVLFALRSRDEEYYKVPNVTAKSLGAGWGCAVIATICSSVALIALVLAYANDEDRRAIRAAKKAEKESLEAQKKLFPEKPATRSYDY